MNPAKLVERVARQIRMVAARCIVHLIDDAGGLQELQVELLAGEARRIQSMGHYGLASHPRRGAEGLVLFVGAQRSHGVVIAVEDRRYRLRGLAEGEVALYTDEGDAVHLKRGGLIEVVAGAQVDVKAPIVTIEGDVTIDGNLAVDGQLVATGQALIEGALVAQGGVADSVGSMAAMRATYNGHTHVSNGPGAPTNTPIPTM